MIFRVFATLLLSCLLFGSCKSKKRVTYKKRPTTTKKRTTTVVKTTPPKPIPKTTETKPTGSIKNTSKKSAPTYGSFNAKIENYIDLYATIAMEQMRQYKVPASITLAQGILESGAGTGELTRKANNHFGIKCHNWKGAKVYHDDDAKGECFRKYSTPKFSFQDHSLFLTSRSRYLSLFKLGQDDYKNWAKGLQKAGYATDIKYPKKLISLIERYKLYNFDAEVLGKDPKKAKKIVGNKGQHTVKKGDTLYSISRKYKISVEQLKEFNGLGDSTIHEGQTLFVQPLPKDF